MKVVILAGGFGTRISEESHLVPKPMITIGNKPILWHIMKYFSTYGFNDFVILAGYKQNVIKEYFANYSINNNDVTYNLTSGKQLIHRKSINEDWTVTIVDSGLDTMTAGRLLSLKDIIRDESFFLTYGDGLSNVNLNNLLALHNRNNALVTLTAIKPSARFGVLSISEDDMVESFREKAIDDVSWINGGFMVVNKEVLSMVQDKKEIFETQTILKVIRLNALYAYKHHDYWRCMDTLRDRESLEAEILGGNAPWMVWDDEQF